MHLLRGIHWPLHFGAIFVWCRSLLLLYPDYLCTLQYAYYVGPVTVRVAREGYTCVLFIVREAETVKMMMMMMTTTTTTTTVVSVI